MLTVGKLIDDFGGNTKFAAVLGKEPSTASEMRRRNSIPAEYWLEIVSAAAARKIEGVTYEALASMAAQKRRPAEPAVPAEPVVAA